MIHSIGNPKRYRTICYVFTLAAALVSGRTEAAISWNDVQWLTWSTALNPAASTGSAAGQQVFVNVTGTNGTNAGAGLTNFDVLGNSTFTMVTPTLGLGAPKGGTVVNYTISLASLTIPASDLIIGISNLDAINGRGSITVSATDSANQASNVNHWITEAQFKAQAGVPAAQALVTRSNLGNNMQLGSVVGPDNTSWGDSRGIFFGGLDADLATITLAHFYNHPTSSTTDSINLFIGIVPEPSAVLLSAIGAAACMTRRQRKY